jgi:hypothetical protein
MADVFDNMIRTVFAALDGKDDDMTAATYTPTTGDPVLIERIHFRQESFESPDPFTFRGLQTEKTVEALIEDFGRQPDIGDTLTISGVDYEITEAFLTDGRTIKAVIR